ncbi:methylmalonyl-CoA mutase family protein, partial [Streptomyces massasporeus]
RPGYDQLGGGFARYAVDRAWVVPHFEKMLYDNALLCRAYAHLWKADGSDLARRVALETADFLVRELRTPEGGFASALDADSDDGTGKHVEGAYYVWTPAQLTEVLGAEDAALAAAHYGVTEDGTFEHGSSVLQLPQEAGPADADRIASIAARLLAAREERERPGRDDKVVAAWNGLAIAALAETGALFDRPDLVERATEAADLLVRVHMDESARLTRTSKDGRAGTNDGVLEDYADVAEGFLALAAVTGEGAWLDFAGFLLDLVLDRFTAEGGALYDTAHDAEALIRRPQDPTDNATPSGWTAAAGALLSYAAHTGSDAHRAVAEGALGVVKALGPRAPRFIGWGLAVSEALLDGPREIAVVGAPGDEAFRELRRTALRATAPGAVLAFGAPDSEEVPLLRDRPLVAGGPAAYVCRHFTCDAPVTDPEALRRKLCAIQYQRSLEKGDKRVVGVNVHHGSVTGDLEILRVSHEVEWEQVRALGERKERRDDAKVRASIDPALLDRGGRAPGRTGRAAAEPGPDGGRGHHMGLPRAGRARAARRARPRAGPP